MYPPPQYDTYVSSSSNGRFNTMQALLLEILLIFPQVTGREKKRARERERARESESERNEKDGYGERHRCAQRGRTEIERTKERARQAARL
jgi:hypothetical protein